MVKVFHTGAFLATVVFGALLCTGGSAGAGPISPAPGYWLVGADGGVFSFNAPFYGSGSTPVGPCTFSPQPPSTLDASLGCGGIAATPTGNGYWLLNRYRYPAAFGQAASLNQGNCSGYQVSGPLWTGLASTPTGRGFFITDGSGAAVPCGDAPQIFSGLDQYVLAAPVVGITATLDGKGYWMVSSDGGVFAVGDAPFEGSLGGAHLNAPVVGIAPTRDDKGYWLVASDGGVFAFGDAVFHGSMGGSPLDAPVVGVAAAPDGAGYWLAAADGGVFSFGSAPFEGSMGGKSLQGPVVGIATYAGATAG